MINIIVDGYRIKTIGRALRDLRRDAGLTQEQIADRALLSRNAIAQCELDYHLPTLDTIAAIAGAVDCDVTITLETGTSDRAIAALVRRIDEQEQQYQTALATARAQEVELEHLRDLLGQRSSKRLDRAVAAVKQVAQDEIKKNGGDHNVR